jgi:molecular chaperone GrpE
MSERTTEGAAAGEAAPPAEEVAAEVVSEEVVEETPTADGAAAAEPGESETEQAAAEVEADLGELLDATRRERDEYLDLAQRTRADFDNFRKRAAAETTSARTRGRADVATELVGVIDNLERALAAAEVDAPAALAGEVAAEGPLEQGIVLTYRELHSALQRAGVEAFDPSGEPFDPTWHEALQTRAEDGADSGTVLDVLQKGYRLDGQLIRAARVVVSE